MTKMAAMPIYGKKLKTLQKSSPEPEDRFQQYNPVMTLIYFTARSTLGQKNINVLFPETSKYFMGR